GVRVDRRRPAGGGGRPSASIRGDTEQGGFTVPLRDRSRGPASADDCDRRRRRSVLGDCPLAHPHTRRPVADGHRARVLPGRALPPGVARRIRGRPGQRRARHSRLADRGRGDSRGGAPVIRPRLATTAAVGLGLLAVVAAMLAGGDGVFIDRLVHPPAIVRAGLVGASTAVAIMLLARGLGRLASGANDVAGMVRGVRLAFLAVAAASAAAGWALGDPLPLVVALVIAGIDVLET